MAKPTQVSADLKGQIAKLRKRHGDTVKIADVAEVLLALQASLDDAGTQRERRLVHELEAIHVYIQAARNEVAALRPDDVKKEFLSKASDELDAIVDATAEATHAIMDAAEKIDEIGGGLEPDAAGKLMDATMAIYEACTFQDITGQRIGKVVAAMQGIEQRVDAMIAAFGKAPATKRAAKKGATNKTPAKKAPTKKAPTKKAPTKKAPTKKAQGKKATTKPSTASKPAGKVAGKSATNKTAAPKKAAAKKTAVKKTAPKKAKGTQSKKVSDADLLEGPQLAGKGKSQAEVDAILASFD